jgi:hypothetical protein
VCLVKKLDNALVPTNEKKRFKVKNIKDFDVMVVLEKWIEFKELIELEREDATRDSQGGSQHTIAMVESSIAKRATK